MVVFACLIASMSGRINCFCSSNGEKQRTDCSDELTYFLVRSMLKPRVRQRSMREQKSNLIKSIVRFCGS